MEKAVAPVPTIVFDDCVRLGFDPKVESDKCQATGPSTARAKLSAAVERQKKRTAYLMKCTNEERPSGIRKHANANMQYATKSLEEVEKVNCDQYNATDGLTSVK